MATYLLAFVIADYQVEKATTKSGIPVQAISIHSEGLKESAVYAAKCVDAMEDLVKVPYSLPKLGNFLDACILYSFCLDNADVTTLSAGAMVRIY